MIHVTEAEHAILTALAEAQSAQADLNAPAFAAHEAVRREATSIIAAILAHEAGHPGSPGSLLRVTKAAWALLLSLDDGAFGARPLPPAPPRIL